MKSAAFSRSNKFLEHELCNHAGNNGDQCSTNKPCTCKEAKCHADKDCAGNNREPFRAYKEHIVSAVMFRIIHDVFVF